MRVEKDGERGEEREILLGQRVRSGFFCAHMPRHPRLSDPLMTIEPTRAENGTHLRRSESIRFLVTVEFDPRDRRLESNPEVAA